MSTAKQAIAVRIAQRRAARAERRGVDLFTLLDVGPGPQSRPVGELRRIWRRFRREHWSAQIVIVFGAVAVAYVAFVVGSLIGVVLARLWA